MYYSDASSSSLPKNKTLRDVLQLENNQISCLGLVLPYRLKSVMGETAAPHLNLKLYLNSESSELSRRLARYPPYTCRRKNVTLCSQLTSTCLFYVTCTLLSSAAGLFCSAAPWDYKFTTTLLLPLHSSRSAPIISAFKQTTWTALLVHTRFRALALSLCRTSASSQERQSFLFIHSTWNDTKKSFCFRRTRFQSKIWGDL